MACLKKIKELKLLQTFKYSGIVNANTIAELSFAIQKHGQVVHKHKCNLQYTIGHDMCQEIEFLHHTLDPALGIY